MALRFSIIIPTHNRGVLLDRCLAAIGELEYDRSEFELLIVDDGSNPPVADIVARHAGILPVQYFRTEGVGPASARNLALRQALGEYVVFTDDDCRPHPHWLAAYDAAIQRYPGSGFGGAIVDSPENGMCGRTSQMLVSFLYKDAESSTVPKFFCSNNLGFPRRELLAMNGFDESFPLAAAEDRYLCARWLETGASLQFVPAAIIEHRQQLNLASFLRQHYRYGVGAFQFWLRLQDEGHSGNKVAPWRFYQEMVTFPFGRTSFPKALVMANLIVVSQIACALGYFVERSHNGAPARLTTGHKRTEP